MQRYANPTIRPITTNTPIALKRYPPSLPNTIFFETDAISRLPNGMLTKNPTVPPTIAIARYFTIYRCRIFAFRIPIAFITPISRNSSRMENVITNFKITKDTMIRQILSTSTSIARIISITYDRRIVALSEENNIFVALTNSAESVPVSSVPT